MNPSLQDQTVALLGNFYGGCRSVRQKQLITSSLFLSSPNYAFIFVFFILTFPALFSSHIHVWIWQAKLFPWTVSFKFFGWCAIGFLICCPKLTSRFSELMQKWRPASYLGSYRGWITKKYVDFERFKMEFYLIFELAE